ncbi:lycopene cyclase family protein [Streptomyces sp. DSM 42041]|uniref:Lycopene cyclase family protein n=1 Tax=Streptomyces hazeniae TaxID=3075538 RepID=A0ABU2NRS3_9ACTN|nr:lycopene cyclase family protein [Streptomyces sp. DSM 42041]MDT0378333.1 lycopene cyclase family protein [Streptomyces sp. DSM 42041]
MPDVDVAIVGAGAAGLSLARMLADPPPGAPRPTVLLIETPLGRLRPPERTWCFWHDAPGELEALATASWPRVRVHGPSGRVVAADISPMRYLMIRSPSYERETDRRLAAVRTLSRLDATVTGIDDGQREARVRCTGPDGAVSTVCARWVFDSRPHALPAARTLLWQHFRGWFLRTEHAAFDPGAAVLMDLRTEQPQEGLSFGYVLPFSTREALVEYTEFSRRPLTVAQYDEALHRYTGKVLGLDRFEVEATEQGAIPMTDGRFPRRVGASVFRIGTAGGATRPSTGYTFTAAQRQVRAVADALFAGRTPTPPPAHTARSRAMDAVMLRALDTGRVDGAAFFERLFTRNDTRRLLRFLDGTTTPFEDLRVGASTPVLPMLRTVAELPWLRPRPPTTT